MDERRLLRQIRLLISLIMVIVILAGMAAFFPISLLNWLEDHNSLLPEKVNSWIQEINHGLKVTADAYPFVIYAIHWLAFSHIIIALLFAGVIVDPVKNRWVINWAIACCMIAITLVFVSGYANRIPFFHQVIDSSFAIAGILLLYMIKKKIISLEKIRG